MKNNVHAVPAETLLDYSCRQALASRVLTVGEMILQIAPDFEKPLE